MKRWMQRLVLMICGLAVGFGVIEIAVRIFSPAPPLVFVPDASLGWVHPRDAAFSYPSSSGRVDLRFNSRGLRSPERSLEKADGTYRILALGDSSTEGANVEAQDLFTTRLEQRMTAAGCAVEVVNSGVGGYGTDQEALFLQNEGWSYSPDLILLMMTLDNDVHDNVAKGYCRVTPQGVECSGPVRGGPWRERLIVLKAFLQAHFHTYFFARDRSNRLYAMRRLLESFGLTEFKKAEDQRASVTMPLSLLLRDEPAEVASGWTLTTRILSSIRDESRRRNADFVVVLVPLSFALDGAVLESAARDAGVAPADMDARRPNRIMHDFGAAASVPIIDLLDPFLERVGRGERLAEGHWNARGHAVGADLIHDELRRLVPRLRGC